MTSTEPDLIIRNGRAVLESGVADTDIAVASGRISALGAEVPRTSDAEVIDADGLIVLPGLIDSHVHFNEPGRTHWEGWEAGTRGAAAGGVTTVLEMPLNASPPTTTADHFDTKHAAASRSAYVDYGLWGGLVDDNRSDLEDLHRRGVVAFKAFMSESGVEDFKRVPGDVLGAGLEIAARLGAVVGVHAESNERTLALAEQLRAEGRRDRHAWVESRPPTAEVDAIEQLTALAHTAGEGARVHIVHVSSAEGLDAIRAAQQAGISMTAETCPHYLAFTEDDVDRIGPALKCAPPIRHAGNREQLWEAVLDGRIDIIGSDHSPCPAADKHKGERDVWKAWGGVSGIQTMLAVLLTEGIHRRGLMWERLSALAATRPAKLFGLYPRKGTIRVGTDADLTLVDPDEEWTLGPALLHTKSGISPYLGRRFRGAVVRTIVRGRTVFHNGEVIGNPGYGQLVQRNG